MQKLVKKRKHIIIGLTSIITVLLLFYSAIKLFRSEYSPGDRRLIVTYELERICNMQKEKSIDLTNEGILIKVQNDVWGNEYSIKHNDDKIMIISSGMDGVFQKDYNYDDPIIGDDISALIWVNNDGNIAILPRYNMYFNSTHNNVGRIIYYIRDSIYIGYSKYF